jgi:hypothetical protein
VRELVVLANLPADHRQATRRVERFAQEWVEPAARL